MEGRCPLVEFRGVSKRFGEVVAVDRVDLSIAPGEFLALLGPSGCGKTTLLRMLAGFEGPDAGRILMEGEDLVAIPPHRRPVNMMFQSYALFPHLSVEDNVAFGLRRTAMSRPEIAARTEEMLALVKLTAEAKRRPDQLSGGQRQRAALARALARAPKLLLLDEPMAALDRRLRRETQFELMEIQRAIGAAFVVVTHDQEEAMALAGRVAVMNRGRLAQVGAPETIYHRPACRFVASFIGEATLIEGRVTALGKGLAALDWAEDLPPIRAAVDQPLAEGSLAWLALRPERVSISRERPAEAANAVRGELRDEAFRGDVSLYRVALPNGQAIEAQAVNGAASRIDLGETVWLSWDERAGALVTR